MFKSWKEFSTTCLKMQMRKQAIMVRQPSWGRSTEPIRSHNLHPSQEFSHPTTILLVSCVIFILYLHFYPICSSQNLKKLLLWAINNCVFHSGISGLPSITLCTKNWCTFIPPKLLESLFLLKKKKKLR